MNFDTGYCNQTCQGWVVVGFAQKVRNPTHGQWVDSSDPPYSKAFSRGLAESHPRAEVVKKLIEGKRPEKFGA